MHSVYDLDVSLNLTGSLFRSNNIEHYSPPKELSKQNKMAGVSLHFEMSFKEAWKDFFVAIVFVKLWKIPKKDIS